MKHKSIFTTVLFLSISILVFSQETPEKYVFLKYKNNKEVKLKPNTEMSIYYSATINPTTKDSTVISAHGQFVSRNSTSVILKPDMEYTGVFMGQDSIKETYIEYTYKTPVEYPVDKIEYITYEPKIRTVFQFASFVSVGAILFIAPIVSFNPKTGDFNGEKYMSIAKPAAVASVLSLTLLYNFEERKVKLPSSAK